MVDEFGNISFATGTVRGTRTFKVDPLGRLTGVVLEQIWKPGENQAGCRRQELEKRQAIQYGFGYGYSVLFPSSAPEENEVEWVENFLGIKHPAITRIAEQAKKDKEEARKRDGIADCTHGFYAYYEGSNDYGYQGVVNGVIEGYGETILGTRGFRSMKARIVALHIRKTVPDNVRKLILRNYSEIPIFNSFSTMVTEYPSQDGGVGISPDTDTDFWTRRV